MSNLAYEPALASEEASQQDISAMNALRPVPRISIQAFCETEGVSGPIERAAEDRRMSKAHLKVHMGGIETAIEFYRSAPTRTSSSWNRGASPRNCSNRSDGSPRSATRARKSSWSAITTTSGFTAN